MTKAIELLYIFDKYLTTQLESNSFTSNLLITPTSKFITEILVFIFLGLLSYEVIYWSGIYLHLWDYHAKDIFTEVPIHCAHLNVRLNLVQKKKEHALVDYYDLKQKYYHNFIYWKRLNEISNEIFEMKKFVKYYFEFSPEDFEMNQEPEFGSTISHLRCKVLDLFKSSELFVNYDKSHLQPKDVKLFNNRNEEVPLSQNDNYLSKTNIETGNTIDAVIVI
ncbi:hypothetical protein KGF56_000533 [Candida oxycetoniae]|uniref:Uncharacterized protein n=1 Tax=Candida oxycetoniae TaxID=497107 RepID=A0AAI9T142_9ASCO|nr:uncharacterized protein KGF56_000533 [Candida oxycetoniae]KAI3406687.1 hypothetical protein KGF56_000533 [Candida oxycetoniae]